MSPSSSLVALALALLASPAAAALVTVPWPTPSAHPLALSLGYGVVNSTGTRFNWYAATLDDVSRFSVALPLGGCSVRNTTTATAVLRGCAVATNFGYFQFSPAPTYCMGEVVVDGKIVSWAGDGAPMFSVTSDKTFVIGALTQAQVASLHVTFSAAAFGVIVADGRVSAEGVARAKEMHRRQRRASGRAPTAEEVAPRTVVALDSLNRLMLVAIDGVEQLNLGLTMTETAEIFALGSEGFPYKSVHALNMDGGGSTTMSASPSWPAPAQVFNRPTNTDTGPISERDVTTIACIAGK